MGVELINILEQISRDKGIDRNILIDALKSSVEVAARKRFLTAKELQIEFNETTGEVEIYVEKTVVESVDLPDEQISLKEASTLANDIQMGDQVLVEQVIDNYGRTAAQLAKQVILQKIREAEIDLIYNDYVDRKGELINGIVQRVEHGDLIVDLGKAEGVLPRREQVFRENFNRGERIRAYVLDVRKTPKNALVILSRTHIGLIKHLFEMEVPEISEGMVEIMGVVREPNGRTKISVRSNDREIDAVGACVGMRGMRVQSIVQELRGEKIDIVEFSEDPETYIRNALSPAKVSKIILNPDEKQMTIIVAGDQMSLAIGKKGQNVRLAAKLVRWKVDIKGPSEGIELDEQHPFLKIPAASELDFLEDVKNTKGLGEKVRSILFQGNLVTYDEAIKRGIKGFTDLTGIGPKKAENLMKLVEDQKKASDEEAKRNELVEETPETTAPDEAIAKTTESETPMGEPLSEEESPEDTVDDEDEEISVQELVDVSPDTLQTLVSNGFETLAELSITPLDELIALDGINEEIGQCILSQAKQRLTNIDDA
jgi:N utilization substance protein A